MILFVSWVCTVLQENSNMCSIFERTATKKERADAVGPLEREAPSKTYTPNNDKSLEQLLFIVKMEGALIHLVLFIPNVILNGQESEAGRKTPVGNDSPTCISSYQVSFPYRYVSQGKNLILAILTKSTKAFQWDLFYILFECRWFRRHW